MESNIDYKSFFNEQEENTEFWGNTGAGALFVAKDTGRILLFLRSRHVNEPGTWNLAGGRIDDEESPKEAVARELEEESGYNGEYKISLLYTFRHRNFKYYNYLLLIPFEFTPKLNWEHSTSKWIEFGDWPSPLHFGMADVIKHAGHKIKKVIDLIKTKKKKDEDDLMMENTDGYIIKRTHLVDDGIQGYRLSSPYSFIRYGFEPLTKKFYIYTIQTADIENRKKGYAKALLEHFFQIIQKTGGVLHVDAYTASGTAYIKHVIERLAKKYNVRLV